MNTNLMKDLLKKKKLTQKDLSEVTGLSTTGINQIIQGNVNPKIETIEKIAKALGVQVSLLLSDGPINLQQNGNININGHSNGEIKHLSGQSNIYTTTAEIEAMKKEIEGLRAIVEGLKNLFASKDETKASQRMTIEAIKGI